MISFLYFKEDAYHYSPLTQLHHLRLFYLYNQKPNQLSEHDFRITTRWGWPSSQNATKEKVMHKKSYLHF